MGESRRNTKSYGIVTETVIRLGHSTVNLAVRSMLPSKSNSVYSDIPTTVMNGLQFGFPKTSRVAPLPWTGVHVLYFFCLASSLQLWCIFIS